jgi:hypothetical protein
MVFFRLGQENGFPISNQLGDSHHFEGVASHIGALDLPNQPFRITYDNTRPRCIYGHPAPSLNCAVFLRNTALYERNYQFIFLREMGKKQLSTRKYLNIIPYWWDYLAFPGHDR